VAEVSTAREFVQAMIFSSIAFLALFIKILKRKTKLGESEEPPKSADKPYQSTLSQARVEVVFRQINFIQ
jgi:hypothetical protein